MPTMPIAPPQAVRVHKQLTCDPKTRSGLLVCQPLSAALLLGSRGHQGSNAMPHLNSACSGTRSQKVTPQQIVNVGLHSSLKM